MKGVNMADILLRRMSTHDLDRITRVMRTLGMHDVEHRIQNQDAADDGPEVEILRKKVSNPCKLGS